jgi:hypothetical protein
LSINAWLPSIISANPKRVPTSCSSASFDFSSQAEWENFYKLEEETQQEAIEWHSSISLESIASFVPPGSRCLIPGCGNSKLPQAILSAVKDVQIVLLDSSQICLNQLEKEYGQKMEYHCGDATKLSEVMNGEKFDIIIDKGLSDVILCGEGWNGPLKALSQEAANNIKTDGLYLLISYRLPKSTQEFLDQAGLENGLEWEFDLPEHSNNRVSVSLAVKR